MIYFARSKFSSSLVGKKNLYLDVTSILQIGILILAKEVGYLLSLNKRGEKLQATIILDDFVNKS